MYIHDTRDTVHRVGTLGKRGKIAYQLRSNYPYHVLSLYHSRIVDQQKIRGAAMLTEAESLFSLSNPLVTPEQLSNSSSQLDGVPADLESSIRFAGSHLTQAAGILLRLPQEIIAHAIVLFLRFYVGPEGGSFRISAAKVRHSRCRQCHFLSS